MAEQTKIEWADSTLNVWEGCQETASPACIGCYARERNLRYAPKGTKVAPNWGPHAPRREVKSWRSTLRKISRLAKAAFAAGRTEPWFVFVNSLSDFWDNQADPKLRAEALAAFREHPHLTLLLLTKRPQNIVKMVKAMAEADLGPYADEQGIRSWWPRNVAIGCTVVTQAEADRDIPHLLAAKAALRPAFAFLSMEPLVEAVDISRWLAHDPVHGREQAERGIRLSGGADGRTGDRRGGPYLAAGGAPVGSLEQPGQADPLRAAPSGTRRGEVSPGAGDDRRKEGSRPGAPAGVSALQGTDPRGADGEPRGWSQEAQPTGQSGTGDTLGAATSFGACAGQRPAAEPTLDWIISGGGTDQGKHKAPPSHPDWFRSLRDQCAAAGTAYMHKQNGEWAESPLGTERTLINLRQDGSWQPSVGLHSMSEVLMARVGKKAAGRLLDGREHNDRPEVAHG